MKIGIDVDGVLASFTEAFGDLCADIAERRRHPHWGSQRGTPLYPPMWDWPTHYYGTHVAEKAWEHVAQSSTFWAECPPMPDAEPFLDWLTSYRSAFHDLYFITQRCGLTAKAQTERWLFLKTGLPCPTVLLSDHKGLIAAGLRLDVFIDDRPENCTNVNVYSPTTRVYMPWRDYNALADTREIRVVSTPMDMLHQEKL